MGLDISAHSGVVFNLRDDHDEDDPNQDYINPHFPHAVPEEWQGNEYVLYTPQPGSEHHSFRAGSYSGYGIFRSTLSQYSLGVDSYDPAAHIPVNINTLKQREEITDNFWISVQDGKYEGYPFIELINFSDAEGCFAGPVCEKIYQDFEAHRVAYTEWIRDYTPYPAWDTNRFLNTYDDFTRAFDLARHDGIVSFH